MKFKLNQIGMASLHVILPVALVIAGVGGIGAYVISKSKAATIPSTTLKTPSLTCTNMTIKPIDYILPGDNTKTIQFTLINNTGKNLSLTNATVTNAKQVKYTATQMGWGATTLANTQKTTLSFKTDSALNSGWLVYFKDGDKLINSNICTLGASASPLPNPPTPPATPVPTLPPSPTPQAGVISCYFGVEPAPKLGVNSRYTVTVTNGTNSQINTALIDFGNSNVNRSTGALFGQISLGNIPSGATATGTISYTPNNSLNNIIYAQGGTPTSNFSNCSKEWKI